MKFILLFLLLSCGSLKAEPNEIVINLAKQRLLLYQGHRVLFSARISSGRKAMATPAGHFVIDLKTLNMPDPYYHMQLPYFMRLSVSPPFGIHYAHDPGYAASHGCVRIGSMLAATALYNLTPIGTGVTIEEK
jgi:lipoprotein-anchoring transpeptidase ErfK/SrfK